MSAVRAGKKVKEQVCTEKKGGRKRRKIKTRRKRIGKFCKAENLGREK
jgi:hypothetical protein